MGYYNLLKILKSILYALKNSMKYICYSILLLLFVCICLLLLNNRSSAMTITNGNNTYDFPNFTFSDKFYIGKDGNTVFIWSISNTDDTSYFYRVSSNFVGVSGTAHLYLLNNSNHIWEYSQTRSDQNVGATSHVIFSTVDIYSDYAKSSVWFEGTPLEPSFKPPVFLNYEDENWGNTLVNGEFTYFYIDTYTSDEFYVYFYDLTDFDVDESLNTNGFYSWSDIFYTDMPNEQNNPYLYGQNNGEYYFAFPCTLPFGSYDNEHDYKLVIQYKDENGDWDDNTYTWTTDFSEEGIAIQNKNKDDMMLSSLNNLYKSQTELNNFFNNNSYDPNNIINNMPNADDYESPTESGIDNLFNTFRNAFTTSQAQTVRFIFPNTNGQYIDIRSDLVTSKIPQPILFLIQTFYWYVICRYIIKDIASTAEKAKSGEILDDTSDGNIKTDLL